MLACPMPVGRVMYWGYDFTCGDLLTRILHLFLIKGKNFIKPKQTSLLLFRDDGYDRGYYRAEYDSYHKKEEPYPERYREPWNGRREPEG